MREILNQLENGNISEFHQEIRKMSPPELSRWAYWLHFNASEEFSDVLVTRAYLHTKLAYGENNASLRQPRAYKGN